MKEIALNVPMECTGRFKLEAINAAGEVTKSTGWFDNIVTNGGLNAMGVQDPSMFSFCLAGTGTTTPAATDTSLTAYLGSSTSFSLSIGAQSTSPYFGTYLLTYNFDIGSTTGNVAEIGIGNRSSQGASGFVLFSHALVLDGSGSPTTITILSTEALRVTYEFRVYPPTSDVTTTDTINGVSTTITLRAANVTSAGLWANTPVPAMNTPGQISAYTGTIGTVTGSPSGTGYTGNPQTFTANAYSANSLQRSYTGTFPTSPAFSFGAVQTVGMMGSYQVQFTPAVNKLNTQTFTITLMFSWARKTLP